MEINYDLEIERQAHPENFAPVDDSDEDEGGAYAD